MPILGAHVGASGGLHTCVGRAEALGAQALQIFVGAPQNWAEAKYPQEQVDKLRAELAATGLGPLFVHAPYLINLASPRPDLRAKSIAALRSQLVWADRIGAVGVVVHVGSGDEDPLALAASAIAAVLDGLPGTAMLLLENDAGSGHRIGRTLVEIGDLIARNGGNPRLGVTLDTCHLLASGYEIRTAAGLEAMLQEAERAFGLERIRLVHANDSKTDLGSNRDRHENIGRGFIGEEAFARILHHPVFAAVPFVLEVPGFAGDGPDAENLAILRRLAGQ
jgi:deoxyribonuclease-4